VSAAGALQAQHDLPDERAVRHILVSRTRALAAAANCSANVDTPPVPSMTTIWPRCAFCPTVADYAASPAVGNVAASS
jgi:hypothetical protein